MRILYVTQWFDPEPAFKGAHFARALADHGHEIEVVTGFPNYPGGKIYPGFRIRPYQKDVIAGLTVHRVPLYPSHDASSLKRIANYLSFFVSVLLFGLWRGGRYDAVYVYHPPITPAIAAVLFCRWHHTPIVAEIQDLWPDSVVASGMGGGYIPAILNVVSNFVYRRATAVIAQSNGMRDRLELRGVPAEKLDVIFNWATYSDMAAIDQDNAILRSFTDRINIVYGGNFGQAQKLDILIDAAIRAQRSVAAIRLHLIGDGMDRPALAALIERQSAQDIVCIHPPVQRDTMDRIFDAADILALHLKDDPLYDITIPSKTQHYLACGKPVIGGIAGEAAQILRDSGAAMICPPEDVDGIARSIVAIASLSKSERTTMGSKGRDHYQKIFGLDRAIEKTLTIIRQAIITHKVARA